MEITFPSHDEAERAILGICLYDGHDQVAAVLEQANPKGLFYDGRNSELWARIERLHEQQRPIDVTLIAKERVSADVSLEYVSEILNGSIPAANLRSYLAIAADYQKRRTVIKAAYQLLVDAQDVAGKLDAAVETAESAMYSMQSQKGEEKTLKQGVSEVLESWQWAHEHPGVFTGIPSGIHDLDQMTWGFQNEHLIVIGARPSQGKTALLCTIAAHTAMKLKVPTLFFSLESSMKEILKRIICGSQRMDSAKLRKGNINEGDFGKIHRGSLEVAKSCLHIIDAGTMSIGQMRSKARRYAKKHGIRIVIVDYLQKAEASKKSEKRTYEVGDVSNGLKEMAKELHVPVVTAAQLNRESDREKGRRPRISDLGDSGMIERDADEIMLLYRQPEQKPEAPSLSYELLIGKHRDGDIGMVPLQFFPSFTKFESQSHL